MVQTSAAVVVGVDGTPESRAALHWAYEAAKLRGTELQVVVAEDDLPDAESGSPTSVSTISALVAEFDAAVSVQPISGDAAEALSSAAFGAELLVVGNRGLGRLRSLISNSVTAELIGHSPVPLILVRDATESNHQRIVAGVDEHTGSQVLEFAFAEAALRSAELRVVSTWEREILTTVGANAVANDDISAGVEAELDVMLTPFRERFPQITVTTLVEFGSPAASLAAEAAGADLVVVGAHGQGGLARLFIGSIAQDVIHEVAQPVAVVTVVR